jgi:predicted heme/steroid binding protein
VKSFTREELAKYTGENGTAAYVALKGKVYDVTECFLWRGGRHQVLHRAGRDLTDELAGAPHGEELLERAVLIGTLEP